MIYIDVVSDTSPLIFLENIDSLYLLRQCFRSIIIPERVMEEWGVSPIPKFIQVKPISSLGKSFVEGAVGRLHRGELEVIRLARETDREIVLMDDLLARHYAERQGLIPLGVLGILKMAYDLSYLPLVELKLKINELIDRYDLFISPKVLKQYLASFE